MTDSKPAGEHAERYIRSRLAEMVASDDVAGAVVLLGDGEGVLLQAVAGEIPGAVGVEGGGDALFDLASLSKPLTAIVALQLHEAGQLSLESRIADLWPYADPRLRERTLESLLRHRSGLRAWTPLYARCEDRLAVRDLLLSGELLGAKRGTYSDLGYILWGFAAEEVTGLSLDELLRTYVLDPLGIDRVCSGPAADSTVVPCTIDNRRERQLAAAQGIDLPALPAPNPGTIQDGNARWLGGYSGHAGLFGTGHALWRLGSEWLRPRLLNPELVRRALSGTGRFRLGWWRARVSGAAGPTFPPDGFGHNGFTGGSLWIDPAAGTVHVLLASRAHAGVEMDSWRRRLHGFPGRVRRYRKRGPW